MVKLTTEEFRSIDNKVREVLREPPIIEAFGERKVANGKKEHLFLGACDMPIVNVGDSFSYDVRNYPKREETGAKMTFLTFPVKIKREDIDASESAGLESLLVTAEIEGHNSMLKKIEEVALHGRDERGSKGLCNYSGRLSYGSDALKVLTGNHAFFSQLEGAISQIRGKHIKNPYKLIASPGIMTQLRTNWTGAQGAINEYSQFKETYLEGNPPIIDQVIETNAICTDSNGKKATLSTSNQSFMVCKMGEPFNYLAESYIMHREGIPGEFESDIDYAIRWAGGFIPYEANAACLVTGLTTSTAY